MKKRRRKILFRSKKNKGTLTLQDLFSREILEHSLNNLPWIFAENPSKGQAWEVIKYSEIESVSPVLVIILSQIKKNQTFGDYTYYFYPNRIERTSPLIKPKTKFFEKFKLSSPYKIRIRKKEEPKGLVTKIE